MHPWQHRVRTKCDMDNLSGTSDIIVIKYTKHRVLENHYKFLDLNISGNELQAAHNTKYLGVQTKSSLDWIYR